MRTISSALVNRVVVLNVRVDVKEWLVWAKANAVRSEILAFVTYIPAALMRSVPRLPVPFSTPRAWASLSRALDLADRGRITTNEIRRALAFGRVSAEDAALFCAMAEEKLGELRDVEDYLRSPSLLPESDTARWFIINRIRQLVQRREFPNVGPEITQHFLEALPNEFRFALLVDLVEQWAHLGATRAMFDALAEVTGL